jgi:pyruvate ferredoxin oxidoreductase alpha subunit
MIGSFSTKAKAAVDRLRRAGDKVGLIRPRMLRPFPGEALAHALVGRRAAAVIDQNLSVGFGGVLHSELATALYGRRGAPVLVSYVAGLGGRDLPLEELCEMAREAMHAGVTGEAPPPRLVYTQGELEEMRKLQTIAHALPSMGGSK